MRYTYKVREIGKDIVDKKNDMLDFRRHVMSQKKLIGQLDHKKEYHVEYTIKNNFISTTIKGKENK